MIKVIFVAIFSSLFISCQNTDSPILSPAEAIKDFELEEGFTIECVAAEPDVQDPVAIAFDDDARMWVVEMRGYMPDADGLGETVPNGRIKVLEDQNGDGKFETVKIIIDSLVLPRAVCPVYDGLLVVEPPYLRFYDRDGKKTRLKTSDYDWTLDLGNFVDL